MLLLVGRGRHGLARPFDFCHDRLRCRGPGERDRIAIPRVHESVYGLHEVWHAIEDAPANRPLRDFPEPSLDEVQPT